MKRSEQNLFKTGLIYHSDMLKHFCTWDVNHIEIPDRLKRSYDKCVERGLVKKCVPLEPRFATREEIQLYHGPDYVELFSNCDQLDEDGLVKIAEKFDDVYVNQKSYHAAMLSAGCCIEAAEAVLSKKCDNSIALVRPPGHHAMANEANGFCLFNNMVIVTRKILTEHNLERILIVDWDVHHGQGTQRAFYDDPRVLYFSIHRYENGLFWPWLRESDWDYIGDGKGEGFNVNFPLNEIGMGDSEYIEIFLKILLPIALEFKPQLILISAGYDCAIGCPEGKMNVTPACFAHLTQMLMSLSSHGNVCVLLEGGYCLESLEESVAMTLRTLLGDPCPLLSELKMPHIVVTEVVMNLTNLLKNYWKCFQSNFVFDQYLRSATNVDCFLPLEPHYLGNPIVLEINPTRNKYTVRAQDEIEHYKTVVANIVSKYNFGLSEYVVALGFDNAVQSHFNRIKDSPEAPYRLDCVLKKLKKIDLLKACLMLPVGRKASTEELCLVHDLLYLKNVENWSSGRTLAPCEDDTYFCEATFDSASYAVGVCLNVVDSVLSGQSECGFALIRPPGHLASTSQFSNYCIFNNVSIAAKYAQAKFNVEKIMIVDLGVNFGFGSAEVFENDENIAFVSIHKCMNEISEKRCQKFVPKGYNANICLNQFDFDKDSAASSIIFAFLNIILPIAYRFSPQLIFISAGFGQFGKNENETRDFAWCFSFMTRLLSSLANGKFIWILEEGNDAENLKRCVASCIASSFGVLPTMLIDVYSKSRSNEELKYFSQIFSRFYRT